MKKVSRTTEMKAEVFFSDDVMINILLRLPAKKLAQCRCVCKSWNLMITSKSFVEFHFVRSTTTQACILYKSDSGHPPNLGLYCESKQELVKLHNPTQLKDIEILGSCNGVLCIRERHLWLSICLWNPSINKHKILPSPGRDTRYLGFGVNSMSGHLNDFKVVSISYNDSAKVYSSRTDLWHNIIDRFPSYMVADSYPYDHPVLVNGHVHWCTQLKVGHVSKHRWLIVSFDLANEVFQTITFPQDLFSKEDYKFLKVVDGCLCIFSTIGIEASTYEIWVMKEYGVVESWTRTYIIENPGLEWWPLGFTSSGSVLARGICERLLICEPVSEEFKCLVTHSRCCNPRQVLPYVETLIAPLPDLPT